MRPSKLEIHPFSKSCVLCHLQCELGLVRAVVIAEKIWYDCFIQFTKDV